MLILKAVHTSPLSFFAHNENSAKKRNLYTAALNEAKKEQLEVIREAEKLSSSTAN